MGKYQLPFIPGDDGFDQSGDSETAASVLAAADGGMQSHVQYDPFYRCV